MFPKTYFPGRFFPSRFFPGIGGSPVPPTPTGLNLLDVASDQEIWDNQSLVTYQRQTGPNTWATGVELIALSRASAKTILDLEDGEAWSEEETWHVRQADLSFMPARGDRILDDDDVTYWYVYEVNLQTWGTRWQLRCRRGL